MESTNEATPLLGSQKEVKVAGLGFLSSIAYIISLFGVAPIIVLPGALEYCGVLGFVIVIVLLIVTTYTAVLLSKSWLLLEEHWPKEASLHSKYPYSALAQRVGGNVFGRVVKIIQNLAILGETIPILLLASDNLENVIDGITNENMNFSFCYILIATSIVLIPFLWLGTPKDLRYMTWVGAGSVISMSFVVTSLIFLNAPSFSSPLILPRTWSPLAYCFGAVSFQFGIHPIILTLQIDMKDKRQLPSAIVIAFIVAFCLFGMVATSAFFLYGDSIQENLMKNFPGSPILYIAQGILSIQSLICLALGINALFQDVEETIGIPNMFGWRRVLLRTTIMLLILFVAESIPHFAIVLELVGGLLMTPIMFIFPPLFYNVIKYRSKEEIKMEEIILGVGIILLGVIGCVATTTESGIQISLLKEFAPPCYIDFNTASQPSIV